MPQTTSEQGSYWLATTTADPSHPSLNPGEHAEIAVVGGGIAGVTTALMLARAGADVVLLEAGIVGGGVSGATTAKVTSAHGHCYAPLADRVGTDEARAYGQLNERALHWMAELVRDERLDCDWEARDAWTYALDPARAEDISAEARAAAAAGLPSIETLDTPLPFDVANAMRVTGQAQCHARKYVLELARLAEQAGARIREQTRVLGVSAGSPCVVQTQSGELTADRVVIATHFPILDRGLYFARLAIQRSYCVAARAEGPVPDGMFFSIDSPSRSLRTAPLADGGTLLIAGGESHVPGKDDDTGLHYRALWDWMREHFEVHPRSEYRWSAQDPIAADGLPYAGPLHPLSNRLFVITGLRKWGFTNGTAAAQIVAARLLGTDHEHASLFDPSRLHVRASAATLARENLAVAKDFVGARLANLRGPGDASELAPGDGAVVAVDGKRAAAYRDGDGVLHAVSPTCTHLGCEVRFNPAERSWDCPCHGSRFDVDGNVLEGPAVHGLAEVRAQVSDPG